MKRKKFLFLVLIVPSLSLSAQSRIEISGKDTMVVMPLQQLRVANGKFIDLNECREERDSLFSQIRTYTGMVNNLRSSITDLKEANRLNELLLSDKQKIIDISEKQLKKSNRKIKFLNIQRTSLAGVVLIMAAKIFIFK